MSYPGSIDALQTDVLTQDTDGTHTETFNIPASSPYTHRLGAAFSGPLPSGWQIVPKGAFPVGTPGAPSGGTLIAGDSLLGLTSNGVYQWAVSNVTAYGETPPGTAYAPGAIGVGTGYQITMPANSQGTTDAPVISRKLWRTKNGGSTFYFVRDVDLDETTVIDGKPDDQLIVTAPSSNTSGVTGTVTATGSSQTWAEVAPGTSLSAGQFIVDYGTTLTGGTITFAAADAGKSVTLTWTGALLVNEAFVLALVQALKDLRAALGTPNMPDGVVVTDGNGHITNVAEYQLGGTGDKLTNSTVSSTLLPGLFLTDGVSHTTIYGLTGASVAGIIASNNSVVVTSSAINSGHVIITNSDSTGSGAKAQTWQISAGDSGILPYQVFFSRTVSGSTSGWGGGNQEVVLAIKHDGNTGTGTGHRQVIVTNRSGGAEITLDGYDGSISASGSIASGNALSGNTLTLVGGATIGGGVNALDLATTVDVSVGRNLSVTGTITGSASLGAANGIATLDNLGHVIQPPSQGVMLDRASTLRGPSVVQTPGGPFAMNGGTAFLSMTPRRTDSSLIIHLDGSIQKQGTLDNCGLYVSTNGGYASPSGGWLMAMVTASANGLASFSGTYVLTPPGGGWTASPINFFVNTDVGNAGWYCDAAHGTPIDLPVTVRVTEIF